MPRGDSVPRVPKHPAAPSKPPPAPARGPSQTSTFQALAQTQPRAWAQHRDSVPSLAVAVPAVRGRLAQVARDGQPARGGGVGATLARTVWARGMGVRGGGASSSLPAPCQLPALLCTMAWGWPHACQGRDQPGPPSAVPGELAAGRAGDVQTGRAGLPAAVWAAGSPWDTDTPCPCFPAWSSARLSCLSTARKQAHKQPAPGTDRYPQGQTPPGPGSQARPAVSCPCKGSRLVLQAPGLPPLQRQPLVVGSPRGLPRPPPCLRRWPEGSGCTRHICIQAEPGFTSPPRLTVPVLAGSPSSRPGKDR